MGSFGNNLEMRLNGRNEGPTMVVVDEFSKSPLFNGGGQPVDGNEQVGGNGVEIEEVRQGLANNDIIVIGFGEGEWWKKLILPQRGEKRANVTIPEVPLSWSEAIIK